MSENQLQATIFQWAWNTYPQTRYCLWAVPNGGKRNKIEAQKLKATGTLAGVHDLHFIWKGIFYTFELKVGNNKLSSDQVKFKNAIESQGAKCFEIRTFIEFVKIFEKIISL